MYAEQVAGVFNFNADGTTSAQSTFDVVNRLTTPKKLKPVRFEIKAVDVTEDSATLKWSSPKIHLGYTVCKYNIITKQWEELDYTSEQAYKVSKLKPDTSYKYCVKDGISDDLLGAVEFTTITKKASIHIDSVSSAEVKLSFANVDKGATVILYRKAEDEKIFHRIARIKDGKDYTDTKVEQGKTYSYRVKSVMRYKGIMIESEYSTVKEATTLISLGLPDVSGKTKTFAYYTAVTAKSTPQYKLLNSEQCYTDPETGIRMYDGCYCVALGSFYGSTIGTKYRITFSTGVSIEVILCDQKANRHTDEKHQYAVKNQDIVEFYVEKSFIPSGICGSYNNVEQFKGDIVSIETYANQEIPDKF